MPILDETGSSELARLGDAAVVRVGDLRLAFTTDAFVVAPPFFPGSNIGELAVNGTVNDLAMMGAQPLFVSAALILEEGLPLEDLGLVVTAMAKACRRAGVQLVTGDTKVVERGSADGLFVITSGIGIVPEGVEVGPERARPGDRILLSGPVASPGVAVMSRRAGIAFEGDLASDTRPLAELVRAMLAAGEVRALRDATRGGLASVLNELAEASGVAMVVEEAAIPVLPPVRAACEMLGLDPLYVANEGVCVAIVAPGDAEAILEAARRAPGGERAALIGEVTEGPARARCGPRSVRHGRSSCWRAISSLGSAEPVLGLGRPGREELAPRLADAGAELPAVRRDVLLDDDGRAREHPREAGRPPVREQVLAPHDVAVRVEEQEAEALAGQAIRQVVEDGVADVAGEVVQTHAPPRPRPHREVARRHVVHRDLDLAEHPVDLPDREQGLVQEPHERLLRGGPFWRAIPRGPPGIDHGPPPFLWEGRRT